MNAAGWDALVVLAFILIGGFFAAAEMALVSLREGQVRALAKRGKRGQRAARLAHDPNRFLSAVQIGVTVATLLSGAFGAATLVEDLRRWLVHQMPPSVANPLAFVLVTLVIAFFSLVPIGIPLVFLGLHLGVAVIQAYVFFLLAAIYLSLAVAHDH